MDRHLLAEQLRNRQRKLGRVPEDRIAVWRDDAVIDSYVTCSCCGEREVDDTTLAEIIGKASDCNEFFDLLDATHKKQAA